MGTLGGQRSIEGLGLLRWESWLDRQSQILGNLVLPLGSCGIDCSVDS